MSRPDVLIVGAGPAGIFCALELSRRGLQVLMLEKGLDIEARRCPMKLREVSCRACPVCALLSGWGGAGAFSDGKLNLSPQVGGFLLRYLSEQQLRHLIQEVDALYLAHGAPRRLYGAEGDALEELSAKAARCGLQLLPTRIRHIGTDRAKGVLKRLRAALKDRVQVRFESPVKRVLVAHRRLQGVELQDGTVLEAPYVVLAPGREGAQWLQAEARRLRLGVSENPVDIGLRVEVPAAVMEPLTRLTYEPKLIYYSRVFDDKVRTFCVNPHGEVVKEYLNGLWSVNGHSYARRKTENTNFALLVSTAFTEPFHEPVAYGRHVAKLANFLGQGVLVQRLGDLKMGRRSTPERLQRGIVRPTLTDCTPGDLSFALPYRFLAGILEMLEAMDCLAPGVASRHTLLYGVEVKFYSMRIALSASMETRVRNLFAVGDGAGVSRGLVQASASGLLAAREILRRLRAS
jgi:hypothetical protein